MAGCELNIAHAFVAAPTAHRLRHDVIVTSADDFDASRRRRCVDDDDDTDAVRGGMIPHYRLVPSAFGPGSGGEWVTLSKSVLLQLVERICQLSFQSDSLAAAAATAACPSSDRLETSSDVLMETAKSADAPSSVVEAERQSPLSTGATSDDFAAAASTTDVVSMSNTDSAGELTPKGQEDVDDVLTSDKASDDTDVVVPSQELNGEGATEDANCNDDDEDDSEVFTDSVAMQESVKAESCSSLAETLPTMSTSPDVAVVDDTVICDAPLAVTQSPTTPLRSTQSLRSDRRRRLRELRRLRRRHQGAGDDQSHDHCRDRRRDAIVRRRFATPRQLPPRFQQSHVAHVERHPNGATTTSPMLLPVGCRYGRLFQPWSALNKVVVCQLVDVVLSQELTSPAATWRAAAASSDQRRSSGTIWNPAITPETRECRNPTPPLLSPTISDLSSLVSPSPAERSSSTLLQSLLSPMAAAACLDCRRSDMSAADADVGGGSLAWTLFQSSSSERRRHHSAAASDTFHLPWTSPSFFWYNVPPSQGNFLLLPDVPSRPCYRWIGAAQAATLPSASTAVDTSALDYRSQTLDAGACSDAVDNQPCLAATAVSADHALPKRRGRRPLTPPASRESSARLKWVVVNKTDVCSLFESLASSMVTDSDEKRTSQEPCHLPTTASVSPPGTDHDAPPAVSCEPIKWKSTLLRRARAEAQTPKRSDSDDGYVAENTHVSFHVDC